MMKTDVMLPGNLWVYVETVF